MGEAVMINPLHEAVGSVKDSDKDPNEDPSTTLFHRRIEFHLARKPFTGFGDGGNSGFKLETLNPDNSNSGLKSEPYRVPSVFGSGLAKTSEENNSGLDPDLSFRMTFRRIGAGLQNLGNTCFLNSVLQCLTYTEPLAAYLQSGTHKTSCRTAGFCALCAIQKHVSRALESTGRILAPKDLVSNLRCISRNFRNARQEDAHEYMVNLLESMHKCCLPLGVPSESPSAYEKSLVHKIFGGRLRSQVKCMQCSFCSNKFDPFLDLSLEIVKADSLYKALAHFTAKEQLDGGERQYQCQQCKQKVKALKQLTVYKAPQVLTIHLKRFGSHTGQKIDRRVEFGPTLDLKPFVTGPYEGDLKYTLYGVLVHAGWSTHSGHYYCFVRTSSGMWYTLDDNQVYQVSERKVLEQKAYMLFYVRDRRNTVSKKSVDIIQKESMVINTFGSKGYNNLNQGLKETIQNESFGKNLNDTLSVAVAQKDVLKAHSLHRRQMQMDCGQQVNVVAAECSLLKKGHPTETSLEVPPKVDSTNGFPISNLTGGDGSLQSAASFEESNGSLSLGSSDGRSGSSQSDPSAPISVRNENIGPQNCAVKNESDSLVIQSTCNGNTSSGKDLNNAVEKPPESNVSRGSCGETSILAKNNSAEDGGLSGTTGVTDSAGQNVHDIGEVSVPKEPCFVCKRAPDSKLHVVKRRPFKCHVTRMHLSSNILFAAALGRKKKKHRSRRNSSNKQDGTSVLSDLGLSTSENSKTVSNECSGHSPMRVKSCSDDKKKCLKNAKENGDMALIHQELRNRVGEEDTVLSNDMQSKSTTSITKLSSSRESRCSNYNRKDNVENGLMSMLTRGLEETTVARWDGVELPISEFGDSQSTESVSIGYVADEWDEEYDCGKRKKLRNKRLTFGGPNPFQEIAIKKAKMKKQKLDRSSSANQPFRI